ncbi:hypothetical protein E4K72_07495 [Oxalobacteraceae bacterium OM1]|nr:hypothetical protein E4K72_07495 [Oxalobacteraceae bacterium OM1]
MNTPHLRTAEETNAEPWNGSPPSAATDPGTASVPPTGNTGGKLWTHTDPDTGERFLIRPKGHRLAEFDLIPLPAQGVHAYSAITDYLNCTFRFDESNGALQRLFHELFDLLGPKFAPAVDRKKTFHFYARSFRLGDSGAILGIGGQESTVLVSLPGEACTLVCDWAPIVQYFRDYRNARITRWDGAVDDYLGIHSVDSCLDLYKANAFTTGGNRPKCSQKGNWFEPDGSGRSFYVGVRENGKMLRVYEKGMELGARWHPWVRWEIELHNKSRVVPWEVLLNPGGYFVGAYPRALKWVQDEMSRIATIQKQRTLTYLHLTGCLTHAYGRLVDMMLQVEGSADAVVERIRKPGIPKRLQHAFAQSPADYIAPEGES